MADMSAEIAAEQAYFDAAARERDRRVAALGSLASSGADRATAARLRRHAEAVTRALGGAADAVAFGRIDDESGEQYYLGRHLIGSPDGGDPLVINWQSPAAARYFTASPDDPQGLVRRRGFQCTGNVIDHLDDVLFAEIAAGIAGGSADGAGRADVDAHLLTELARGRTGTLRDIVATIQAAQYELIRAPLQQVLVIEGGPGTGKTAIALHRVSWLLFQHPELTADDVLVVGPHPTFMRYIGQVLPGLGDAEVELRDISRLAPTVRRGRAEPVAVARLKGDARMAGLLDRALRNRIGTPDPAERLLLGSRFVTLPGEQVQQALDAAAGADLPYNGRRQLFRDRLADLVHDRSGVDPRGEPALVNLVERLWPQQSPAAFLRGLLASRPRLRAAAGPAAAATGSAADGFTADELALLHRRGADRISEEIWSAADLPLLDELDQLIDGGPSRRYGHVVVDEAQDLSPMQLRAVARRSRTGSCTVIGDLAQSTGGWARDSWDEVTRHLPTTCPVRVAPLRYGYRVPRQAYQFAARLLPVAAPGVTPPEVVRDGPAEPGVHRVGLTERAGRVVAVAGEHAARGAFVGVVCPPRCRREVEAALADNGLAWSSAQQGDLGAAINLVSPAEAKGLEFDAVVVVEPEQIVADDERGHRMLYVALTRTTGHLDVVCVGDPLPLTTPYRPDPGSADDQPDFTERSARLLAEHLAGQLRAGAPAAHWAEVLDEVRRQLDNRSTVGDQSPESPSKPALEPSPTS
ncbi:ATP-binding domain-containing protein [Solwaraspora sp. WMMD792]|uniref:HelD family protein n=1 Tax=Solwaraspora sp. WMMD792 TaxID=3016099 RepID=UPI002416585B|nr:ATP-binding domain-containing protein [Solwaraspora sp. WMMD792]MDG4775048.1 ATP-binding domain-containing protein [Solwaraspora sp. WMMD792]